MVEKTRSLDIFVLLSRFDSGEKGIWQTLTEEEQKGLAALVAMRWMSGCYDQRQIIYLNEFVNHCVFAFGKHPELLMDLLEICSSKQPRRYFWLAAKGGKKSKEDRKLRVICDYFKYSVREAKQVLPLLSNDDILEYATELGYQKEEIQLLKKELS